MRVLFLFGAGASTGSEREKKHQPPLGLGLFDELRLCYTMSWGTLKSQPFEADFERAMSQLMRSDPIGTAQLQREMAEYFFQFEPSSTSLYSQLVDRLSHSMDAVAFATLNYERLLELALFKSGFKPICGQKPNRKSTEVELCFPHGCCHFWVDGFSGPLGSITFPNVNGVIDGTVKAYGNLQEFGTQVETNPLLPVMSYIEPDKTNPVGKIFIDEQRTRCSELIKSAEQVIIIGIRIRAHEENTEHDKHLWEPLRNTTAKLIYCGGERGGVEFDVWHKKNRPGKSHEILRGKFQEHFEEICEKTKDFLSCSPRHCFSSSIHSS